MFATQFVIITILFRGFFLPRHWTKRLTIIFRLKPPYWVQIFLSTVEPIFLRPWRGLGVKSYRDSSFIYISVVVWKLLQNSPKVKGVVCRSWCRFRLPRILGLTIAAYMYDSIWCYSWALAKIACSIPPLSLHNCDDIIKKNRKLHKILKNQLHWHLGYFFKFLFRNAHL